jgi:hypothetical protein
MQEGSMDMTNGGTQQAQSDRRTSQRQPFSGSAEIIEQGAGTRLAGRVGDLSPDGCYIDTINPLPVGTSVRVKIVSDGAEFQANGMVRNSQPGMGMGLAFASLTGEAMALLRGWLGIPSEGPAAGASMMEKPSSDDLAQRLISLLREKQILSDKEVAILLRQ